MQVSVAWCYHSDVKCSYCVLRQVVHIITAGIQSVVRYSEGPATGHLDTGFSWFPCV